MAMESKEWVNVTHRSYKRKSGGVFVYIDSVTLVNANVSTTEELQVKRYPSKEGTVILRFRRKK